LRDEVGVVHRAQAVQARNLDLSEETSRLRTLFEQAPGFVAILDGPKHEFVLANEAYRTLVGKRDLIGKGVAEALPEIVDQGFVSLLDNVRNTGVGYVGRRARVMLDNGRLGATGEAYYLDFLYQPILGEGGEVTGVFVQGHDVTEQVEAEERQKLLINELNHRVKNTLAIVQGLAMQSFRRVENSEAAQRTFDSRLNALAAAHTLLTEHEWELAELTDVLRRSVEATAGLDSERVHIDGPDIMLVPQTAVSLAMMIHELSTNAIKYGALSVAAGRVDIGWTVAAEADHRLLAITWRENGGPRVVEPERRGFGTRLIERGMTGELKGEVRMEFRPEGLHCTITARLPPEAA
jgi:PAS domain S-box-containing protein